MASGIGIEVEEMGMVALIGIVLLPGLMWIAKAKTGKGTALRSVVVAGLLAGAVVLEVSMDKAAGPVTETL